MIAARQDRTLIRVFFALVAIVYLGVYPYLQAINNPNENTRTYLVMALVDHGTWKLDEVVKRFGWTNDMAKVPDATAPSGFHLAAVKGPAMTYAGIPVYVVQKGILRLFGKRAPDERATPAEASAWLRITTITLQLFCVHLPCLLFLVYFERKLRRWSRDTVLRLAAVAAVGLGSNYLAYSFVFVSHATSAATVFVAYQLIAEERLVARGQPSRVRPWRAFSAGLAVGMVTLLEYQGLFLSIVLALYGLSIFRAPRGLLAFAAGGAWNVALLCLFQWASFGNALTPGHRMMENTQFGALVNEGFLGFTGVSRTALWELAFSGAFGLFATTPFHWAAFFSPLARRDLGRRVSRERAGALAVAAALVIGLWLAVSASVIWRGGWTIGPRYLTSIQAVVALLALVGLTQLSKAWAPLARGLAVGLAAASFLRTGLVSLLVSTLPEEIVRPLPQIALPFLQTRLFPHHALELVGIVGATPFWLVPASAAVAVLLPLGAVAVRLGRRGLSTCAVALVVLVLVTWPAMRLPRDASDHGPDVRLMFQRRWEPPGRVSR